MDFLGSLDDFRRADHIAQPPAGSGKGLGKTVAGNGSFRHAGQRCHDRVNMRRIDHMLIDFIGNDPGIVFLCQIGNDLQFFTAEYFAAGIGRIAENHGFYQEQFDLLTEAKRSELPDSEFGLPKLRKYPLDTEAHVRSAIKFFNFCKPEDEKELAKNIKKAIKKFGITDIKYSARNRFFNYYKAPEAKIRVQEGKKMNTGIIELNMNELEKVNGGFNPLRALKGALIGAGAGAVAGAAAGAFIGAGVGAAPGAVVGVVVGGVTGAVAGGRD